MEKQRLKETLVGDYLQILELFWQHASSWDRAAFVLKTLMALVIMVFAMRLFQYTDNLYLKLGKRNNQIIRVTLVIMMICAFFNDIAPKAPSTVELVFTFGLMMFMIEIDVLARNIIHSKEAMYKELADALGEESRVEKATNFKFRSRGIKIRKPRKKVTQNA